MPNLALPQVNWLMTLPIDIVAMAGIVTLLMETIWPRRVSAAQWLISLIGLASSTAAIVYQFKNDLVEGSTLNGLLVRDRFGLIVQFVILAAAFLSLLFSEEYLDRKRIKFGEFYPLVLWSTLGAMVMVTTHNLLV